MIVIIGGMQRSGSTFSFNVAREVLARRGTLHQETGNDILEAVDASGGAENILLKSHRLNNASVRLVELGAVTSICTIRKPEDAIASWMEVFGFDLADSIDEMKAWLRMFDRIRANSLVVDYDVIDRRHRTAAWRIARHLAPSASPFEVFRIARRHSKAAVKAMADRLETAGGDIVDIGFSHYDKATFYHRRHVSSLVSRGAAERLPIDTVKRIRAALGDRLDAEGRLRW